MKISIYYNKIKYIRDYILIPTKGKMLLMDNWLCCCDSKPETWRNTEMLRYIERKVDALTAKSYERDVVETEDSADLNKRILDYYKNVYVTLEGWWRFVMKISNDLGINMDHVDTKQRVDYYLSWILKNMIKTHNYQN